ncbi:MAG: class I SAM-dependent methyltransferase [Congregibacter sp.]
MAPALVGQQVNYFDRDSAAYAVFRPEYDASLAESLAALSRGRATAIDVGCGNGQLARLLAKHYECVIALDLSENQLAYASGPANVQFTLGSAERLTVQDCSVDLIVAAQAAHWFDLPTFYAEAQRVGRDGAVIALLTYGVPSIQGPANAVLEQGYWNDLHHFWPTERRHVETGYADLLFPFQELRMRDFEYERQMTVNEFIAYVSTWSAFKEASDRGAGYQFDAFFERLREAWPDGEQQRVRWPLSTRTGLI